MNDQFSLGIQINWTKKPDETTIKESKQTKN